MYCVSLGCGCTAQSNQSLALPNEMHFGVRVQALAKLQDKRVAVEKVVLHYGEAPSGIKEVFELCRGFERAYVNLVNVSLGNASILTSCGLGATSCFEPLLCKIFLNF